MLGAFLGKIEFDVANPSTFESPARSVSMEACHILFGRPWQFDKKSMNNGLTNEINFTHKENKFILNPLPHSQVVRDQVQMKQKREKEKKKN